MPPLGSPSQRWGRRLLVVSVLLLAWAAVIAITGGFRIEIGTLRLSSRNATRVALIALAGMTIAWRLASRDVVRRTVRQLPSSIRRLNAVIAGAAPALERAATALTWLMAAALFTAGVRYGSRVAGGADAFGYLSEATLWAHGRLGIDQSFAAALPWAGAAGAFVPLAYRLGANGVMGPTVAPGLPLLMALAHILTACGPYFVVPLCGAALVVGTFQLGRRIFGAVPALAAAALLACSPVVVFESLVVMSDVPAAAFWIAALASAVRTTAASTLAAGVLSGVAILIRPNLILLALFPWLLAICRLQAVSPVAVRTLLFAAGSMPAALTIALINSRLYGSAFTSGYGDLGGAFSLAHVAANVKLYSGWWLESQGPAGFLFLAALWPRRPEVRREVLILLGYAFCAALLYLFYLPFDQWWYLRFLIPAIPIVMLLCADAVARATHRFAALRIVALSTLIAVFAAHALRFINSKDILVNAELERRRYLDAAVYLDDTLPSEAVVLAMQHSGSVRYYAGRLTMRWDVLDAGALDSAVAAMDARRVPVYALLESWEEEDFRRRFAGQRTLSRLTAGPILKSSDGQLRLYPLGGPVSRAPAVIPSTDARCVDASPRFIEPEAAVRLAGR